MKKQTTILFIIGLLAFAAPALAETAVFTVSVTIPPHVMMANSTPMLPIQTTPANENQNSKEILAQVQQMVRNNQTVLVKSIVVL